jgi:hypothetical protein
MEGWRGASRGVKGQHGSLRWLGGCSAPIRFSTSCGRGVLETWIFTFDVLICARYKSRVPIRQSQNIVLSNTGFWSNAGRVPDIHNAFAFNKLLWARRGSEHSIDSALSRLKACCRPQEAQTWPKRPPKKKAPSRRHCDCTVTDSLKFPDRMRRRAKAPLPRTPSAGLGSCGPGELRIFTPCTKGITITLTLRCCLHEGRGSSHPGLHGAAHPWLGGTASGLKAASAVCAISGPMYSVALQAARFFGEVTFMRSTSGAKLSSGLKAVYEACSND